MITAVDTSVILDILSADARHLNTSKAAFSKCMHEGRLVVCPIVWSEVRPLFDSTEQMKSAFDKMNLGFDPLDEEASTLAGEMWKIYRKKGGSRERVMADFLIGAHASIRASRLLTRDRGFYRSYFSKLKIVEP